MRIVTRNYTLNKSFYIKYCFLTNIKNQWYVTLLFAIMFGCGVYFKMRWMFILALVFESLFLLFWLSMVYSFTGMSLGKPLFERYFYIFSEQGMYLYLDERHFKLIQWGDVLKVKKYGEEGLVFFLSKLQFFYIPRNILKSDIEYKILYMFLKNKGFVL